MILGKLFVYPTHNIKHVTLSQALAIVVRGVPVLFLNQARAGHRLACAWFLKIDPVWIVSMYVCVSAPKAINN